MPAVTVYLIPAAHDGRAPTARPPAPGHRTGLRGAGRRRARLRTALRAAGHAPDRTEALEAACLVWLAGVLVEIAGRAGDARTAKLLADEAAATLAAVSATPQSATRQSATSLPAAPLPATPLTPAPAEPTALAAPLSAPLAAPLTRRELVVLHALQEDVSLRGIADSLHVSLNTVRSQTRSVYRKLGVGSRSQALHRARELRLL
ncbi:LuxR C-terminal-related transcriptional regulator [Streptomyces sp. PA5.6]|uniref:helix-turn-helix transcriptional regulator n=1 Tax=Streptomyces sp. PA5.6 TaxID=3035651 RepID=UPI0039049A8C